MLGRFVQFNPGDDRLSHTVTRAVPWALEGLTTVFGMGTGVTPPVWPPETWRPPKAGESQISNLKFEMHVAPVRDVPE
jgi:hypothetical protein